MTSAARLGILALGALLAGATPGPAAPAAGPAPAPPPVAIATVDIIRLVDKLNEKSDWDVQLSALTKKIQAELDARTRSIQEQAKALEQTPDPQKAALRDKVALEDLQLREWANYKRAEIDRERALMWQSLYRNIRSECGKLAEAEGYDLILVNDGVTDLQIQRDSQVPMEQQAQEQIMRRRMLYANKAIDVTDKLILRMNNARNAAGASGAAPAAPGAPGAP
jgi:Skp family chaperone for outer membrane proteins